MNDCGRFCALNHVKILVCQTISEIDTRRSVGPHESINCGNRGIGRRNNMPARSFLINVFPVTSKFCTPNVYCWSRKTVATIHWTHLRANLICSKPFDHKKTNSSILLVTGRLQRQRRSLYLMFINVVTAGTKN